MESKAKRTSPRRILEVLEAICQNPQAATSAHLAEELSIPLPTIYRLLNALTEEGFAATAPSGRFIPGPRLRSLVLNSLQYEPNVTERRAILRKLSNQLGETVSLSVPEGTKLVYFDRVESHWPFQINLKIGDPLPLYCCASGKLFLSSFESAAAVRVFEDIERSIRARNTITKKKLFAEELKKIADQGYALDDQEWFDDMVGASVPIKNANGALCACLSTHALNTRKPLSVVHEQIPIMQSAAGELEKLFFSEAAAVPSAAMSGAR